MSNSSNSIQEHHTIDYDGICIVSTDVTAIASMLIRLVTDRIRPIALSQYLTCGRFLPFLAARTFPFSLEIYFDLGSCNQYFPEDRAVGAPS